jgi:N-acetylmuramoyl-L-alanine amidase
MTYLKWGCFAVGVWLISLAATSVSAFSPTEQAIFIDGRRLDLSTPVYQNQGVYWAPLRDVADALNFDMAYLPKDTYYRLNHRETGQFCIVIENTSTFWVEHVPCAFPQNTRRIENQLYVPLDAFLKGLDWPFSHDKKGYHISTKLDNAPPASSELRLTTYAPPADSSELPFFEQDQSIVLAYRGKSTAISGQIKYLNGQLYLPATALAVAFNVSVRQESPAVTFRGKELRFEPGTAEFLEGKWYVSLAAWLQLTGTSPQWVPQTGTLIFWDQLRSILMDPPKQLILELSRPLDLPPSVKNRDELVVTMDSVIAPISPSEYTFSTTAFRYFKLESSAAGVRLRVGLRPGQKYAIHQSGKGGHFRITLAEEGPALSKPKLTQRTPIRAAQLRAAGLENKRILIDAGHGGSDPGAPSNTKEPAEKFFTLDISHRLKTLLEKRGATVIMVREGDQNPSLQDRVVKAQLESADVFVSVHINSFFQDYANGTETFYYKGMDKPLARIIHQKLVKALGLKDLGLKENRLYVLRNSRMPAVLVEPCFLSNPREQSLLGDPNFRQRIAQALYDGLEAYFR